MQRSIWSIIKFQSFNVRKDTFAIGQFLKADQFVLVQSFSSFLADQYTSYHVVTWFESYDARFFFQCIFFQVLYSVYDTLWVVSFSFPYGLLSLSLCGLFRNPDS